MSKRIHGLDRLRIFAMTLVLGYHFFGSFWKSGFIGVNILFVLSGFLITYHLTYEVKTTDSIALDKFYNKRFNRIVPAVILMILLGIAFLLFINKDYRVDIARQIGAAFSFSTNWYEIATGASYESQFIKHIFLHTWSLGIEVHFYIIWPLILICMRKRMAKNKLKVNLGYLIFKCCVVLSAIAWMMYLIGSLLNLYSVSFMYFGEPTRLLSFFIGAATAGFVHCRKDFKYKNKDLRLRYILYFVLIVFSFIFNYDDKLVYAVIFLAVDLITSAIILSCCFGSAREDSNLMKKLSIYSYPIYIFHWPVWVAVSSFVKSPMKYAIVFLITAAIVSFNQTVWEPVFNGKNIKTKMSGIVEMGKYFILIIIFISALMLQRSAPKMIKLESDIWAQTVENDIKLMENEKIEVDEKLGIKNSQYVNLKAQNSMTIIGDSVMLAMANYLSEKLSNCIVNAEENRAFIKAPDIMKSMEADGKLGNTVVIAMGLNDMNYSGEDAVEEVIDSLPKGKRLILVVPFARDNQESKIVRAMRSVAPKYKFVTLMDWEAFSKGRPDLYEESDGVHFFGNMKAYEEYYKLLRDTHIQSLKKPKK